MGQVISSGTVKVRRQKEAAFRAQNIVETPQFRALVASRWRIALFLTALMVGAYFSFVWILAVNKALLSKTFGGITPIGIPVGIGLILFAWALTGLYVWWANRYYDKNVSHLKRQLTSRG